MARLMGNKIWDYDPKSKGGASKCPWFDVQKGNFVGRNGGFLSRIDRTYVEVNGNEAQIHLWGPKLTRQPVVLKGSRENLIGALEMMIDQVKALPVEI